LSERAAGVNAPARNRGCLPAADRINIEAVSNSRREVRVTRCGWTVLGCLVAACAALAAPARAQEATAPQPPPPETALVAQPACALTTSYKTCRAACREMFPPKPKVETVDEAADRARLAIHGWWALGTGGALLVAGAVMGGVALHLNAELGDECPGGSCPPAYHSELDTRDHLAVSSTILLGAGVAASAVGILILSVFSRPPKGEAPKTAFTPVATPGTAGATWAWRF
jgi:hypothetical protein